MVHIAIKIFLDKQQLIGINVDSCAAKLLKAVVENGLFRNIYSKAEYIVANQTSNDLRQLFEEDKYNLRRLLR